MEFCVTHSDPPVRTNLLGLSSSQDNPQFKDGTVYRQVRPGYEDVVGPFDKATGGQPSDLGPADAPQGIPVDLVEALEVREVGLAYAALGSIAAMSNSAIVHTAASNRSSPRARSWPESVASSTR